MSSQPAPDQPAPAAVPALRAVDPSVPSAVPAVEGPAPAPGVRARDVCHGSRPCKRLVILGSVTGALGVATVVAGAVLAARPNVVDGGDPTMAITYRPAGTAVLTIGIGVLATGVLMALAAGRASRQARRAALAGVAGPGFAF